MFVVFNHLNGMFRSHHLIIGDTILDYYYYLADVLALLNILYRVSEVISVQSLRRARVRVNSAAGARKKFSLLHSKTATE